MEFAPQKTGRAFSYKNCQKNFFTKLTKKAFKERDDNYFEERSRVVNKNQHNKKKFQIKKKHWKGKKIWTNWRKPIEKAKQIKS